MNNIYSTGQIARLLSVPAHRISYAHSTGQLAEPSFRFLGKRCYSHEDLMRVAAHFGVPVEEANKEAQ